MPSGPKVSRIAGMDLHPRGRCLGVVDAEGNIKTACTWNRTPGDNTRRAAKFHASTHPGHVVRVISETFDDYKADS